MVDFSGAGQGWASGCEDHFVACAAHSFQGEGENELSFQAGANINIAPKGTVSALSKYRKNCFNSTYN